MRRVLKAIRDNSLSLALFVLFVVCIGGAAWAGWWQQNDTLAAHHLRDVGLWAYLGSGTFIEGLAVNWQAALLQLGSLVIFSSFLYQRGSPHSRNPQKNGRRRRRGRSARLAPDWLKRHSMFIAFAALFVVTFAVHAGSGVYADNAERALTGEPARSFGDYLVSAKFWWETFQTWQAEYLVIALYLVLSIFLRQEDSAESKPPEAADSETGKHND